MHDRNEDDDLQPDPRRKRTQQVIAGIVLAGFALPFLLNLLDLVGSR